MSTNSFSLVDYFYDELAIANKLYSVRLDNNHDNCKCDNPCSKRNIKRLQDRLAYLDKQEACVQKQLNDCGELESEKLLSGTLSNSSPYLYIYKLNSDNDILKTGLPVKFSLSPLYRNITTTNGTDFTFPIAGNYIFEFTITGLIDTTNNPHNSNTLPAIFGLRSLTNSIIEGSKCSSSISYNKSYLSFVKINGSVIYKVTAGEIVQLVNIGTSDFTQSYAILLSVNYIMVSLRIEYIGND